MAKPKRQANYELLRIIAMLMVVILHYLSRTGALLVLGEDAGARRIIGTLLEAFCIVAVNVYVLISGYFLIDAGFKVKRILVLICQVMFYSLSIPLIMLASGITEISADSIYGWMQYMFPIGTEHYWFATSYVMLYLFTPVLNAAVKSMNKRQLQIVLAGLLICFCGIKSIFPVRFVTDRFGYDFGWFLCVYLTAAYIKLYGLRVFSTARRAWLSYIGGAAAVFGMVCGFYYINLKTGAFNYYFEVPFHYNYILCLAAAVSLFYAFRYVKIPEGRAAGIICAVSPLTFGVYLFHEHIDIRMKWTGWINNFIGSPEGTGAAGFLLHLLLSVILIYLIGIFIDGIRRVVFSYAGRHIAKTKLVSWINKIDNSFS